MLGVVPAAGEGTRLRPLTDDTPKGLVEVAGRPLLAHVFETLADSGVEEIVVVVGYEGDAIREYFGDSAAGLPLSYVEQDQQSGLGHAVLQAESHVDGPFVVLNGDNVVAGDLRAQIARQRDPDVDAVVAVEEVDPETARETGVVAVEDGNEGAPRRVTDIVEKPADPPSTLATTGAYVLPAEVFDAISLLRPSARGEYELADALGVLIRAGARVEAMRTDAEFVNVNAPADRDAAARLVGERD
ncbi:sugar phosphate nucleotidyltransferase [Halorussus gelatinilyticus]|uniref:Sugar phosphate nucleotidyltransferase n=1 Tax=Halorussus gelatinilyticus TaxID=2937524 RepID=A0A8U0IJI4_9EURY|nr:sugar phosphate nucleotidyltransferase [Halorussus gelatinilyticus]UPW01280.1 sugar phosphate nucleotidyltransferase [Halorussus gelatinilyticus]